MSSLRLALKQSLEEAGGGGASGGAASANNDAATPSSSTKKRGGGKEHKKRARTPEIRTPVDNAASAEREESGGDEEAEFENDDSPQGRRSTSPPSFANDITAKSPSLSPTSHRAARKIQSKWKLKHPKQSKSSALASSTVGPKAAAASSRTAADESDDTSRDPTEHTEDDGVVAASFKDRKRKAARSKKNHSQDGGDDNDAKDVKSQTVSAPAPDILDYARHQLSIKRARKHIAVGLRVKVRFSTSTSNKKTKKRWFGGKITGVSEKGTKIRIKYDDGTAEVTKFPEKDIIVDDTDNGTHHATFEKFLPPASRWQHHRREAVTEEDDTEAALPEGASATEAVAAESEANVDAASEAPPTLPHAPGNSESLSETTPAMTNLPSDVDADQAEQSTMDASPEDAASPTATEIVAVKEDETEAEADKLADTCNVPLEAPTAAIPDEPVKPTTDDGNDADDATVSTPMKVDEPSAVATEDKAADGVALNADNDAPSEPGGLESRGAAAAPEATTEESAVEASEAAGDEIKHAQAASGNGLEDGPMEMSPAPATSAATATASEAELEKTDAVATDGDAAVTRMDVDKAAAASPQPAPEADRADVEPPTTKDKEPGSSAKVIDSAAPPIVEQVGEIKRNEDEQQGDGAALTVLAKGADAVDAVRKPLVEEAKAPLKIRIFKSKGSTIVATEEKVPIDETEVRRKVAQDEVADLVGASEASTTATDAGADCKKAPKGSRSPKQKKRKAELLESQADGMFVVKKLKIRIPSKAAAAPNESATLSQHDASLHDGETMNLEPAERMPKSPRSKKKRKRQAAEAVASDVSAPDIADAKQFATRAQEADEANTLKEEEDDADAVELSAKEEMPPPPAAESQVSEASVDFDETTTPRAHLKDKIKGTDKDDSLLSRSGRRAAQQANERISSKQENAVQEGGPKKKRKKERFRDVMDEGSENVEEDIKWVQCDKCKKWRVIPVVVVNELSKTWYCADNVWDLKRANCDAPEQSTRQVIKQRKKRKRQRLMLQQAAEAEAAAKTASDSAAAAAAAAAAATIGSEDPPSLPEPDRSRTPLPENPIQQSQSGELSPLVPDMEKKLTARKGRLSENNLASLDDPAVDAPKPRGRGRPRRNPVPPKETHESPSASAGAIHTTSLQRNDEADNVEWVQCEKCDKWRKLPPHIAADDLPEVWYCSMNTWNEVSASCDAPEDKADGMQDIFGSNSGAGKLTYRHLIFGNNGRKPNRPMSERTRAAESLFATPCEEHEIPTVMYANSSMFISRTKSSVTPEDEEGPRMLEMMSRSNLWAELWAAARPMSITGSEPRPTSIYAFDQLPNDMQQAIKDLLTESLGNSTLSSEEILRETRFRNWENAPQGWIAVREYCDINFIVMALLELVKEGVVECLQDMGPNYTVADWNPRYRRAKARAPVVPQMDAIPETVDATRCMKIAKPWKKVQ